jgi:hypothetical protein
MTMDAMMISGVLYALLAGLMWGLIFVGPLLVPVYRRCCSRWDAIWRWG